MATKTGKRIASAETLSHNGIVGIHKLEGKWVAGTGLQSAGRFFDRAGWRCRQCVRPGRLECDHIRPLDQCGRKYDLGNLQALCRDCHIRKTARENEAAAVCLYPQQAA